MANIQRAKQIFLRLIDQVPPERWESQLEVECAGDSELKERVSNLLEAHIAPGSFLDRPVEEVATVEHLASVKEKPGEVIERYKLLEQIGEGGFGFVYMAEQTEPVHRRVAIKIIKPGMDTKEVIARFEAERQALALMEHPNIARVLDAGTTESGRPYFVMELVKGLPVTDHCDKHGLTTKERLRLFIDICHGVQHAHQKGIIHRDIKPSNILVTLHDGVPVPKVIDFGIAKATSQRLTEKTLFTSYGQFIGTPQYMSPEQSELSGLDMDTRTDIYSLGALLYELLIGSPPFDPERLRSAGFAEMMRIIREEEPPKPSQRLSASDTLPSIAAKRHDEPKRLTTLLRGELDWVVMKALEKDRSRRYETATGLANDIQRFLNDEPVSACPPSLRYRFQKFARRNKVVLATVSLVAVALIVGLLGTTWQAYRAIQAQRRADDNYHRARQAVDEFFTTVSETTLLDEEGMQPLRKQLLDSALHYYEEFAQQQTDDPAVLAELAATHYRIAMTQLASESPNWVEPYQASLEILERLVDDGGQMPVWADSTAGIFTYHRVGSVPFDNPKTALAVLERGGRVFSKLVAANPTAVGLKHDLAASHFMAGNIYQNTRQPMSAVDRFQKAKQIWESLLDAGQASPELAGRLADTFRFLADSYEDARQYELRNQSFQQGIAALRRGFGKNQPEVANLLRLAPSESLEERESDLREAIAIYRNALDQQLESPRSMPEVRWNLSRAHTSLGRVLQRSHQLEQAEQELLIAKELVTVLAEQNPSNQEFRASMAGTCGDLASVLIDRRKHDQAEQELTHALTLYQTLITENPTSDEYFSRKSKILIDFSRLYRQLGRFSDAELHVQEVIDDFDRLSKDSPEVRGHRVTLGHALWELAEICQRTRREDLAKQTYRRSLEVFDAAAQDFPEWQYARLELGHAHWLLGNLFFHAARIDEAQDSFLESLQINNQLSTDFPDNLDYALRVVHRYRDLIRCTLKQDQIEQAIEFGEKAVEFCRQAHVTIRPALIKELPSLQMLIARAGLVAKPHASSWQQKLSQLIGEFRKLETENAQP